MEPFSTEFWQALSTKRDRIHAAEVQIPATLRSAELLEVFITNTKWLKST